MIKVHDFFAQDMIFEQRGAVFAGTRGILVIADTQALISGEGSARFLRKLSGSLRRTVFI